MLTELGASVSVESLLASESDSQRTVGHWPSLPLAKRHANGCRDPIIAAGALLAATSSGAYMVALRTTGRHSPVLDKWAVTERRDVPSR